MFANAGNEKLMLVPVTIVYVDDLITSAGGQAVTRPVLVTGAGSDPER
jgi:hypothetical protein